MLRLIACVAALGLFQVSIAYRVSYGAFGLDVLFLLAAYLALEATPRGAVWSAFAVGLARDALSIGPFGLSAAVLVVGSTALVYVRGSGAQRRPLVADVALVFLYVAVCGLVETMLCGGAATDALGRAALTALLSPAFILLFDCVGLVLPRPASDGMPG